MLARTLLTAFLAFGLVACGGRAETEPAEGSGGTGAGASSGGASSGGAPGGGTSTGGAAPGGAGGAGGAVPEECTPKGGGEGGFQQPTCADLSGLSVTDAVVTDASGDGVLSAGEKLTIAASLNETAGEDFMWYPGVRFESASELVTVKENDWYYGIAACQTQPVTATGEISASAQPGTTVIVTARVGMINEECPSAPALEIPLDIE